MDLALHDTSYSSSDQTWLVDPDYAGKVGCTLDLSLFNPSTLTGWTSGAKGAIPAGLALGKNTSTGRFGPYAGNANEVATVTVAAASTGGTFTITVDGETTAAIAFDATAAAVKTALGNLSNLSPADLTVTGPVSGVYTITFGGARAGQNMPAISVTDSTTGSGHAVTAATATGGGSSASDGTEIFAGILWDDIPFTAGATTGKLGASRLIFGMVYLAKLPVAAGSPGGVDTLAQASTAVKLAFV